MTYGVPYIAAARLLEAGMESRLLAVRLVSELGLDFSTREGMLLWMESCREGEPVSLSNDERAAWQKFLALNEPSHKTWHRRQDEVWFELSGERDVESGELVRIVSDDAGHGDVFTVDFDWIGEIPS